MNIENYLTVPYVDGGRDFDVGLDCWGLVRHVLHHVFDGPLMNAFGSVFPGENVRMTERFDDTSPQLKPCKPKAGALACCFYQADGRDIFHHVGICISEHQVLHTSSSRGPQIMPIRAFKRLAFKVEFYAC